MNTAQLAGSTFSELPVLNAGLGFREPLLSDLFLHRESVDFLEIVADHYLDASRGKLQELDLLAANFTLVPHALNLSLGSSGGIDPEYLAMLADLVDRLRPPWWSEHIAFTRAGDVEIGHLAGLPFTDEAIAAVCRNVEGVKRRISVPLILENVTYTISFPGAEMDEARFLTEIVKRTDCGLLLDVTNLYVNSVNHGYDPCRFLDALPLERVVQLHFVGVHTQDGTLVDSHAHATPREVWQLLEEVLARAPVKGVLLERDANFPAFAELTDELDRAREIGRRCGRWT